MKRLSHPHINCTSAEIFLHEKTMTKPGFLGRQLSSSFCPPPLSEVGTPSALPLLRVQICTLFALRGTVNLWRRPASAHVIADRTHPILFQFGGNFPDPLIPPTLHPPRFEGNPNGQ